MLKTIKDPQPSRNPKSIVLSEPSQNPCNMYSIYKKKLNNEPQQEQNPFLCKNVSDILTSEKNADSCRIFMSEADVSRVKTNCTKKNNRFSLGNVRITLYMLRKNYQNIHFCPVFFMNLIHSSFICSVLFRFV